MVKTPKKQFSLEMENWLLVHVNSCRLKQSEKIQLVIINQFEIFLSQKVPKCSEHE